MQFYISPSKQLFCLFSVLYLSMICAVQYSSLYIGYKLFIILVLIYHGVLIIKTHALRITPQSPIRICCKNDIWHIADRAGHHVYGKLNKFVYINKVLIILSVVPAKHGKPMMLLITQDSLPPLQFRRLSMHARC